jgi:ABC-2 type transport system permease protein
MLTEIIRFEVRYHLKQLIFYVCLVVFFFLTFGAVTSDSVQIGGSIGNIHRNAPFVIMRFLMVMSVFAVFTTTAFVSNAALRDYDLATDSLFFSSPIRKRDYLLGRFTGSVFISFLVYLGVVAGIMVGSFMPWLDKDRIGPFTLVPYLYSLFVLVLPTVLLVASVFFCVAALTRSTMATYASAVAFLVSYVVADSFIGNNLEYERVASLFDPLGLTSFALATRYWTVAERNSKVLPLQGLFLWNRLIWIGVAVAIFAFTLWKFRVEIGSRKSRKAKAVDSGAGTLDPFGAVRVPRPLSEMKAVQRVGAAAWFPQFGSTFRLELRSVVKSVPFLVILFLGLVNVTGGAAFADSLFDTKIYPVTGVMLRTIDGAFVLFALMIVTFFAGEIVWRERQLKLSDVTDSMPVRSSAIWSGKLVALWAIVVLLMASAVAATIAVQTAKGYHHYELGLYARGLLADSLLPMFMMATLAFFLQVVVNNKYAGFLGMLLYFVSLPVLPALHLEHYLYRFAQSPVAPYSDMNGFGNFVKPLVWFNLYWMLFCGLLVVAVHLLWVRGSETAMPTRLRLARARFGPPSRAAMTLLALAFVACGSWIFYNTNVLNHYRTADQIEKRSAEYEKKYKRFQYLTQPKITDVQADVDIDPAGGGLAVRGLYTLVNKSGAPIPELHVAMNPDVTSYTVTIPGAVVRSSDKAFGYTIYGLSPPLAPGASLPMRYTVNVTRRGFVNSNANTDIVGNGTFVNNLVYFPHIAYQPVAELQDRNKRKKYGLGPAQRLPKLDDPVARNVNELTGESDWLNLDTTVSTSADQIAIAPGYLQEEWTSNGRRYFHYRTTSPILGFWSYLSARYQVRRDHWKDVAVEVYYDAKHPYNVERMIEGVKRSLDYYTANFSPYQHKQVRILEFPRYARFAQSFPNTIPFSESIGFIADLRDKSALDYVFYVTAHEVAHQWWAHQVVGAQVQGATMITETMAQYSALMVMEKEYGRDQMRKFLAHELNAYLQGRGGELIGEMPLVLVENQGYIHYRKGSLVMYALRDFIGEEGVNHALRNIIGRWAFHGPPYVKSSEMVAEFRAMTPPERRSIIHDLFETITLYDNKDDSVSSTKQADGTYRVHAMVEARKLRANGMGDEKEVPLDDWIDLGVLATGASKNDDKVLAMEKHHLASRQTTVDFVVNQKPVKGGIDPLNKLIDRNPEDNTRKVAAN